MTIQTLGFPSSVLLALAFTLGAYALHRYAGKSLPVRALRTPLTSRILLAVGALMLAIEGTWSVPLHSSALFVIYALVFLLSLALVLLHRVTSHTPRSKAEVGFLLNHLGIFIIVWAALFGAPDVSRSRMIVPRGCAVNYAHAADGTVVPLPFNVALENFRIDYYDDNVTPRQYTSAICRISAVGTPSFCSSSPSWHSKSPGTASTICPPPWIASIPIHANF